MEKSHSQSGRLGEVQTVLVWTLVMNLAVCAFKIVLGISTGIMAITADGLHSLGDSLSNVVGFAGIRLAMREPDDTHGYGYEKYEAITTLLITGLISITCYKVFESGIGRLLKPEAVGIPLVILPVMLGSMAVNVATIIYEGRAGRRLKSVLLIADSNETLCDLWVSGGVVVSTFVIKLTGWQWLDGFVTIAIGFLILHTIWEIIKPAAKQLADAHVVEPGEVEAIVMTIPGVRFCHAVRSRGRKEAFFLDLHLGVDSNLTIEAAHDDVCHRVKVALREAFPELKSALIHIEPDTEAAREREGSVFRARDPYGHKK